MKQRICPLDGKPCEKSCPDRYKDDPRGGCILVAMHDMSEDYNAKKEGGDTMNENIDRTGYIAAITKLLQKADLRKLRLIWVYCKGMTR